MQEGFRYHMRERSPYVLPMAILTISLILAYIVYPPQNGNTWLETGYPTKKVCHPCYITTSTYIFANPFRPKVGESESARFTRKSSSETRTCPQNHYTPSSISTQQRSHSSHLSIRPTPANGTTKLCDKSLLRHFINSCCSFRDGGTWNRRMARVKRWGRIMKTGCHSWNVLRRFCWMTIREITIRDTLCQL